MNSNSSQEHKKSEPEQCFDRHIVRTHSEVPDNSPLSETQSYTKNQLTVLMSEYISAQLNESEDYAWSAENVLSDFVVWVAYSGK